MKRLPKGYLLACLAVLSLLGAMHFGAARDWNPNLSHDTIAYFYPRLKALNPEAQPGGALRPFLVDPQVQVPMSDQSKSVFTATLIGWHRLYQVGYRATTGRDLKLPDHPAYSDFVFATLIFAFLSVCWMGWAFSLPWLGLGAATLTFVSAWGLTVNYFSTYTALSIGVLVLSYTLALKPKPNAVAAGALCFLNLLINQSMFVFTLVLGLVLAFRVGLKSLRENGEWRFRWKPLLLGLWPPIGKLAGGFIGAWALVELSLFALGKSLGLDRQSYHSMTDVVLLYLNRSFNERSEYFSVYKRPLFPLHLWIYSPAFALSILATLIWTLARYWKQTTQWLFRPDNSLRDFTLFLLGTVALVEFKPGPRFSRTYFLFLPFLSFAVLWVAAFALRTSGRRALTVVATLLAAHLSYSAWGLVDLNAAAVGVLHRVRQVAKEGATVATLRRDSYSVFFMQMDENRDGTPGPLKQLEDICQSTPGHLITGPNRPSILNYAAYRSERIGIDWLEASEVGSQVTTRCGSRSITGTLVEKLPFFSHYPLLVLEDPQETTALLQKRHYDLSDYRRGKGAVRLWKLELSSGDEPGRDS